MKKEHIFLVLLLLLLAVQVQGQKQQTGNVSAASCTDSPLFAELSTASGTALLSAFGYSLKEPWACAKIESPWTTGASLLHFRKISAQSDDATAFSVLKVAGFSYVWIIPTESGMLEVRGAEGDLHNLAAFNALLRSQPKAPSTPSEWNAVGKLYMALLGHEGAIAIESEPDRRNPCTSDGECTLAFADRTPHAKEPYTKWTLTFSAASASNAARLTDVMREVVSSAESWNELPDRSNGVSLSHEANHVQAAVQQ